jgi:hypothetical protein
MEIRIRKIIFIVYSDNEIVIYKSITNNVKKSCIKVIYLVLYALNLSIFLNIYDLLVDTNMAFHTFFHPKRGSMQCVFSILVIHCRVFVFVLYANQGNCNLFKYTF